MLSIRYSDPPETEKETKARKDSKGPEPKNNFDITNYVHTPRLTRIRRLCRLI